jgi:hypothetical protein
MKLQEISDVVVGGLVIEVNSPNQDLINNGLLGHYLAANLEIGIRDDIPTQLQANVLTHELVHAIANVYCEGLNLDEAQVSGIAQGFYQVLTDNEDLVRFITATTACDCERYYGPATDEEPLSVGYSSNETLGRGDKIVRTLANAEANNENLVLGQV